jgi:ubiquinone/menaquinone biosynthesis C-methylase UbiE
MSDRPIGLAPGAELEAAGQDARKYGSRNPVVRRLIDRWLLKIGSLIDDNVQRVADIGVGEGLALERLPVRAPVIVGVDFRGDKLAVAKTRVPALRPVRADAGMLPIPDRGVDLALCIEVLEHLVDPGAAVAELARIADRGCVVSVPWEPFFRLGNLARGKNVAAFGNDSEHVQQFSPARLADLLQRSFAHVSIHRCFPWIIAVARHRPG